MMPRRFRDRLAVTQDRTLWMATPIGATHHLEVRPNAAFQSYFEKVSKLTANKTVQDFKRFYFGAALEVDVDNAGRILVPASLRQRLELTDKITFIGVDEHYFEIWNPEALDARFAALQAHGDDIANQLAELGL